MRLRSGWFSDRSATYLAAGRPVITQETGFSNVLPTGEGLFAFTDDGGGRSGGGAINADYDDTAGPPSRWPEILRPRRVLARLLADLGTTVSCGRLAISDRGRRRP